MLSWKSGPIVVAGILLGAFSAGPAAAARMVASYSGDVHSFLGTARDDTGVFGPPGVLQGHATLSFVYDTGRFDTFVQDFSTPPFEYQAIIGSGAKNPITDIRLTINGRTVVFSQDGALGMVSRSISYGVESVSFSFVSNIPRTDGSGGFRSVSLDGRIARGVANGFPWAPLLSTTDLDAPFQYNKTVYADNNPGNMLLLDFNGTSYDTAVYRTVRSGAKAFGAEVFWDTVSIAAAPAIPEPDVWIALVLGFTAVGAGLRRRNRKAQDMPPAMLGAARPEAA